MVQEQNVNAEQVSAADYDPSLDRREDEQKRARALKPQTGAVDVDVDGDGDVEMIEEEEEEDDDVEDMFAIATVGEKKVKKVKRVVVSFVLHICPPSNLTAFSSSRKSMRPQLSLLLLLILLQILKATIRSS